MTPVTAKPSSFFIFLAGSSAVGKTTILNAFPDKVNHPTWEDPFDVVKVDMSVRKIREQLNNPKWDDLLNNSELAEAHQKHVGKVFQSRIQETIANSKSNTIYLFERSPFDVLGYSYAFRVRERIEPINIPNSLWVYRPINFDLLYAIEEARPPVLVRDICDTVIRNELRTAYDSGFNVMVSKTYSAEETVVRILDRWSVLAK